MPVKMPDLEPNTSSPLRNQERQADSVPAWQPMTFRGVAKFAESSYGRLLVVQMVVALVSAISVVCFVRAAWEPVFSAAARELPDQGRIQDARLVWGGESPRRLAESRFLSIVVDRDNTAPTGPEADVEAKLGLDRLYVHSLLGYVEIPYPRGWIIAVNRPEVEPWWGAHLPAVFAATSALVMLGLWVCWSLLALPYALVARFIGFWFDARLTWLGAWRLASAVQLPGALVMAGAILLYGWQHLNLVGLILAVPVHLLVGWAYLLGAPARLARLPGVLAETSNPFNASTGSSNPFTSPPGDANPRPAPGNQEPPAG